MRKAKAKKGMGFKKAQQQIAKKQGIGMERAGAILAAGARKASKKAIKANPNLKKVSGMKKKREQGNGSQEVQEVWQNKVQVLI